ncbi:demethylmenaquinone methyltransferase [Seinonella peptonophila]|nr:demethylmenaquinone methyltransferase [Seinonella peptonophila]
MTEGKDEMPTQTSKTTKEEYVHEVFESIADRYDRMNTLLSFRQHKRWRKFAMRKMDVQMGHSALDVCCGTCDWAISIAQTSKTGRVVGLDFSKNMLSVGQQKIQQLGLSEQIQLVEGNAMHLPFVDDSFDFVTIGFALRNVPDHLQVLHEMKRVVKPGGKVVSLELSKPISPLFRRCYYLYFQQILPWLGKLFANSYEQYKWLPESLRLFPDYRELEQQMVDEIGFAHVDVFPLFKGIAALHIGHKERSE